MTWYNSGDYDNEDDEDEDEDEDEDDDYVMRLSRMISWIIIIIISM